MTASALLVTAGLGLLVMWPAAEAQPAKRVYRVALIHSDASAARESFDAFRHGVTELGYVEGETIALEYRYTEGQDERLAGIVADLVRLKVDAIVTGSTIAARAAQTASRTIPIVMAGTGDPVAAGLVASLARPGGNVTGLSSIGPELNSKRLELLKETVPRASRIGVLFNGANPSNVAAMKEMETVAPALGVELERLDTRGGASLDAALDLAKRNVGALLIQRDVLNQLHMTRIAAVAAKGRVPAMYPGSEYVKAGGLMSYGVQTADLFRRAAGFVDRILKGARPADLPVEQPTKFELVINVKAAKALGLAIPPAVLARADEILEP
jgi:putative ABC transport system substrate-binding protein